MPYVSKESRRNHECGLPPQTAGELNYAISKLLIQYVWPSNVSYQSINDVLGALEGAKLEFYRRFAAHYETGKMLENGDIYPPT